MRVLAAGIFDANNFAGLDLVGGNIDLATVHQDVSVIHELARLSTRSRKAGSVNGIIESTLQEEQQVFACYAFHSRRPLEIISELTFEDKIDAFDFLLLAQLLTVANQGFAPAKRIAMLSGRLCPALFNRTRWLVASITLEKKLCTFAAAQTAHRISIPSQLFLASSLLSRKSLQAVLNSSAWPFIL